MMDWWQLSVAANAVVALSYFAISWALFVPLRNAGELRSNRLGTATVLIFFSCAVGHGLHAAHPVLPLLGVAGTEHHGASGIQAHDALWSLLTAGVGLYYWSLRRNYGRLLEGASLFQDHAALQREAVEVNDGVVQALVAMKLARQLGRDDDLDAALDSALASSKGLVDRLLDEAAQGRRVGPGDFVLRTPAEGA